MKQLLDSIVTHCCCERLSVIVTQNIEGSDSSGFDTYPLQTVVLENSTPKGFGANHNQAFQHCEEDFFCVLNPDIVMVSDPFDHLIRVFAEGEIGISAPFLIDSFGQLQDSGRSFPSPPRILRRLFSKMKNEVELLSAESSLTPDWIAGMFMLFPSTIYSKIGGFDESYFMYCEDADLCKRLAVEGYHTRMVANTFAIHDARRASHKSIQYLYWHVTSLCRFFVKYPFFLL